MRPTANAPWLGPLAALALVVLVVFVATDLVRPAATGRGFDPASFRFLAAGNFANVALQVSIVALIAIGSTVVIFAGGIDLSPGSMIALLTMVFAVLVKFEGLPLPLAAVLALALGALLGAVNGAVTAYLRIPSFITTLAALSAYRGIAFMFNNGSPVFQLSPLLDPIFYGRLLGIPLPLFYVVLFYALAHVGMRYTRLGRSIYAVGGNAAAANLSGINVRRVQFLTFVIAGFMAGVASILMAARLNSGSPNYGDGMELSAIAAAVVGGASLAGGRGAIVNTLIGALTIVVVQNGLNLNAVPTSMQNVVVGAIIVVAVGLDMWRGELGRGLRRVLPAGRPAPLGPGTTPSAPRKAS